MINRREKMKAIRHHRYGPPDLLEFGDVLKPKPRAGEIFVRLKASSANPFDWHTMRGEPFPARLMSGLFKPKRPILGLDFAGTVEAIGRGVEKFKPGDAVFGMCRGAFAEFVCMPENAARLKPAGLSFAHAASIPAAATTAIQCLQINGPVRARQSILINGASGGVGTFAVQIASALGAHVTGVCSTKNIELVHTLGADKVIDYTQINFTDEDETYDLIVDLVGNHRISKCRRLLRAGGTYVAAAGTIPTLMAAKIFGGKSTDSLIVKPSQADLGNITSLVCQEQVTPVIDRTYPLSQVADALRYLETLRARGKVVITF